MGIRTLGRRKAAAGRPVPTFESRFTSGTMDRRLTFSRTGTGAVTYVNSAGYVTTAGINFMLYSELLTNIAWIKRGTGTVVSGPAGPDGVGTSQTLSGIANFSGSDGNNDVYQLSVAVVGTNYVPSFWLKKGTHNGTVIVSNPATNVSGSMTIDLSLLGTDWVRITPTHAAVTAYTQFVGAGGNQSGFHFRSNDAGTFHVYGCNLDLGTTAGAYTATTSAASGAARIDYDPVTLDCKGLLIEEARTNLNVYSADFTQVASWAVSANCSILGDQATAPNGTVTADQWSRTATSAVYVLQSHTKAASAIAYTHSVYVKAGTGTYCALRLQATYPARADVVFNLSTGAISSAAAVTGGVTGASATISNAGNGWYRCTITATSDATTALAGIVSFSANGVVVDGIDSSATSTGFVWGGQMEAGDFATSYIPTTTASVIRNADVCSMATASLPSLSAATATWLVSFTVPSTSVYAGSSASGTRNPRVIAVGSGVAVTPISLVQSTGAVNFYDSTVLNTANAVSTSATNWAAAAGSTTTKSVVMNGGAVATGAVGASPLLPVGATLYIGGADASVAGREFNGRIRSVAYYPSRLTDTQLVAVTK